MKPSLSRPQLGKRGEDIAASYLQERGYRIIERNYRIRYGELDLVAWDGTDLVFIEVKSRSGDRFGSPEDAITPKKRRDMLRAAAVYVQAKFSTEPPMRIDVIGIIVDQDGTVRSIRHTPDIG